MKNKPVFFSVRKIFPMIILTLWLIKIKNGTLTVSTGFNDCMSLHILFGLSGNALFYFPLFVYVLFIWIVYSLINKWRPAVIKIRRLVFAPVMFLLLTVPSLVNGKYHDTALIAYLIAITGSFIISLTAHRKIEIKADKKHQLIAIPADPVIIFSTLIITLNSIAFGYLSATKSPLLYSDWLLPIMAGVSGAIAGHRIAKSLSFYLKYRTAPHTDLVLTK